MTAGPLVFTPDKRTHFRVPFTRTVKVRIQDKVHGQFAARNLSLGGVFLEGAVNVPVGEECRLELHETGNRISFIYTIRGKILRKEAGGVGIKFTGMAENCFMFLQTMILYSSDDPIQTAEHFLEEFAPAPVSIC